MCKSFMKIGKTYDIMVTIKASFEEAKTLIIRIIMCAPLSNFHNLTEFSRQIDPNFTYPFLPLQSCRDDLLQHQNQ